MDILWHGTASIEIRADGQSLLFDPFVPARGAEFAVPVTEYDGRTNIFITHGHFDHIANIPEIVRRNPGAAVYCSGTPLQTLSAKGVPTHNLRLIRPGQTVSIGAFSVRAYPGLHAVLPALTPKLFARILFTRHIANLPHMLRENRVCVENNETLFYEIAAQGKRVCLMGSLNLRDDTAYPTGCDLLILPYNGWEDCFPPAERVIARLQPRQILLDHYDNAFPPITSPIDRSPILRAHANVREARIGEWVRV